MRPMCNYYFRSLEEREAYIAGIVKAHDESKAEQLKRRAACREGDISLTDSGAIFCYSWGYEQTNVDYYQVVSRRGQMVILREIACETIPGSEGFMSDAVRPVKDAFLNPPCAQCGGTSLAVWHVERETDMHKSDEHVFVAGPPPTITKRVKFSQGEPYLTFPHGVGSLVKVLNFGNADVLVVGRHYRSWYA